MPATRYYTVTQEREIKVWATSTLDAARIADAAFKNQDPPEDVPGKATSEIRDRDLVVREDY